jgi:hypothetical protein
MPLRARSRHGPPITPQNKPDELLGQADEMPMARRIVGAIALEANA